MFLFLLLLLFVVSSFAAFHLFLVATSDDEAMAARTHTHHTLFDCRGGQLADFSRHAIRMLLD